MTTAADLWARYCAGLPADHPHLQRDYTAWGFGDGPAMADELGALVAAGIKTATASLGWMHTFGGDPVPYVGEISVILDGRGEALCIIETTEVTTRPFAAVPADFAYDEGEGDRSLAYWRDGHWRYFSRECAAIGRAPADDMPVVCERFRLLFPNPSSHEVNSP